MLGIVDRAHSRRDFLSIGSLALGGMSLPGLLTPQARGAVANGLATGKSVILLFMHGGPAQTETFDPKMSAPAEVRSQTGELKTSIPGVTFGGSFEKLAALAHQMTIVRSFVPGDARHDIKPVVCSDSLDANLGSVYSRVVGQNSTDNGLPTNCMLFPRAVDPATMPGIMKFGKFDSTGELGGAYAPFMPSSGGVMQENMKLKIPMDRLDDRRSLLAGLDRMKRKLDSQTATGVDSLRQQAFDAILGGAVDAFDLAKEDPRTLAAYDTSKLVNPDQIRTKWANYKRYIDNGKSLGKLLLLARRLCERGVGFVTVTTNFVWDMHADANNATMVEGMRYMAPPFDHAVAAFLNDVQQRGLSDDILLVCCGEMGRNPKVNNRGGRDHWGSLGPLMLSGGGIPLGQVIGQSTGDAGRPQTAPIGISNLIGTIFHTLFDVGELRIARTAPTSITNTLANYDPIPGLH